MRFSDPLPLFRPTPGRNTPFNGRYKITLTTVYYRSPGQETHLLHRRYCACEMHGSARIKLHLYIIRFNYFGISRGFGAMLGIRGLTTCSLNSVFGSWRAFCDDYIYNNSFWRSILEYLFKIREESWNIVLLEIPFFDI